MAVKKASKAALCVDELRHNEYYGLQPIFDKLYAEAKEGGIFDNLVPLVFSRENILLAYRNIKNNTGSNTKGTDNLTIKDIGKLSPEEVVEFVNTIALKSSGYHPKPVRRKDIPKNGDPTKTRPLGIPCIWDRLIQQCIKQIMEPICEAKFSNHSYGFRPSRSVEQAIAETYRRLQKSNLRYVIEFDIKGFFDNVNHAKLIKQIWTLGIHDKQLIYLIQAILKAPIKLENGQMVYPDKGTPQGGIISPLLANIVLNELDHWVESNWEENPVAYKYHVGYSATGTANKGNGYRAMRTTSLKEMYIVRYADDFRVFCNSRADAENTKIAITKWLEERLHLEISEEKTRIVNVKHSYMEFLGFKIKVHKKGDKYVVKSHMSDKALDREKKNLCEQAKRIAAPRPEFQEIGEVRLYNAMVLGIQNYYRIATDISIDCAQIHRAVMTILTGRLRRTGRNSNRLDRNGRTLTQPEQERYGKSEMLRYLSGTGEPIYPIAYVQTRFPLNRKHSMNCYTPAGRAEIHTNLRINTKLLIDLMKAPGYDRSAEYMDNRISLFSAQYGKYAVSGTEFHCLAEIHCHHIIPRELGGDDKYENLVLVLDDVHKLIHAVEQLTIERYMKALNLSKDQVEKVNAYRKKAGLHVIS